jgi:hypothetical protein
MTAAQDRKGTALQASRLDLPLTPTFPGVRVSVGVGGEIRHQKRLVSVSLSNFADTKIIGVGVGKARCRQNRHRHQFFFLYNSIIFVFAYGKYRYLP